MLLAGWLLPVYPTAKLLLSDSSMIEFSTALNTQQTQQTVQKRIVCAEHGTAERSVRYDGERELNENARCGKRMSRFTAASLSWLSLLLLLLDRFVFYKQFEWQGEREREKDDESMRIRALQRERERKKANVRRAKLGFAHGDSPLDIGGVVCERLRRGWCFDEYMYDINRYMSEAVIFVVKENNWIPFLQCRFGWCFYN